MSDKISILAIDDDKEILYALGAVFEQKGWIYYPAEDVDKGIKIYEDKIPSIVLIDYHLPGENGIEGVKKIRKLSRDVPIIVFTVEEDQKVADEFLNAGATDFALKPIKAPDIISRINLHIELMTMKNKNSATDDFVVKGISRSTLKLIEEYIKKCKTSVTVEQISNDTGFAEQTIYRYLQYLTSTGKVQVNETYGKVGRPKKHYKIR